MNCGIITLRTLPLFFNIILFHFISKFYCLNKNHKTFFLCIIGVCHDSKGLTLKNSISEIFQVISLNIPHIFQ